MRVLIVADGIPTQETPLTGIFAFDQAKALAAFGVEVIYFSLDMRSIRRKRKLGFSSGETSGVQWHIYSLPVGKVPTPLFFFIGRRMILRLYRKVFRKGIVPSIIHAHFVWSGVIASFLSKKTDIPLVITEHSSAMNVSPIPRGLKKFAKKAYRRSQKVLAVSSSLSNNLLLECGIRAEVVPNIISLSTFNQCIPKDHADFRIVTVSGLIKEKRVINLIKAVQQAVPFIPSLHLDIIGDGYMRNVLEKYVEDNQLSERISFLGYLSREDTAKVYEYSDCFAMVSERETFGVVYVEAMAAGLPVIATRCGGPEDFIDDNVGLMVGVDNVAETARAIIQVYTNRYDRGQMIKRASNYSAEAISSKLIKIYTQI